MSNRLFVEQPWVLLLRQAGVRGRLQSTPLELCGSRASLVVVANVLSSIYPLPSVPVTDSRSYSRKSPPTVQGAQSSCRAKTSKKLVFDLFLISWALIGVLVALPSLLVALYVMKPTPAANLKV